MEPGAFSSKSLNLSHAAFELPGRICRLRIHRWREHPEISANTLYGRSAGTLSAQCTFFAETRARYPVPQLQRSPSPAASASLRSSQPARKGGNGCACRPSPSLADSQHLCEGQLVAFPALKMHLHTSVCLALDPRRNAGPATGDALPARSAQAHYACKIRRQSG